MEKNLLWEGALTALSRTSIQHAAKRNISRKQACLSPRARLLTAAALQHTY